jgi:hypothetical protein
MTKRSCEVSRVLVRLPVDVRQWLEVQCVKNLTSLSSQLTLICRDRMSDHEKAST